jgi:hypothetical protein
MWSVNCSLVLVGARLKNILIVDRDLGFVFWLGQILDATGYVAIPARGVAEAREIVTMLRLHVDVLVVSPAAQGLAEFVDELRFGSPDLQMVDLEGEVRSSILRSQEGVSQRNGRCRDEASKHEWLELIRSLNASYETSASRS